LETVARIAMVRINVIYENKILTSEIHYLRKDGGRNNAPDCAI
jgi:hypothetical protein